MGEYAVIGDQHITHKTRDRAAKLFADVESRGLTSIWLGDLLDTKEVIRGLCFNLAYNYFAKSALNHIVLVGNHDWFNLECNDHSLQALKSLKNVRVVDAPTIIDGMLFVPYIHDLQKLRSVLDLYRDQNLVLFAHLEVSNFDFGNGHMCENGLSTDDLRGYKRVISGHFHKYQSAGNLTYIGTPFSQSFGETDQVKYIGTYRVDSDELILQETAFPRHITKEFNCDLLDEHLTHALFINEKNALNNFYRVILTGTEFNIAKFPKYMYDEGGTAGKLNIKWVSRPSDSVENDVVVKDTESNEAQFVEWAKSIKKLDVDTIKLGLQILEACR